MERRNYGARRFDALLIAAVAFASLFALAVASLRPAENASTIAVIFPPWTSAETAFARAVTPSARFVRYGGFSFIAVVAPERRDYATRVAALGAWLVADPRSLAACIDAISPGRRS